nr:SAM-dependent methyltransferase [Neobacillus sp. Marseille-Q6967]
MNDQYYDALLNIKTVGEQKRFSSFLHYHRYEPTPYSALEHLFAQNELKSSDHVVDFGCGKGRLNFYIYYLFHSYVTGIEMNENYYQDSLENQKRFLKRYKDSKNKIQFLHCAAEKYPIKPQDNIFYFFNPFTIQIFMVVIKKILLSHEQFPRKIELVLYYPSEDYIFFLENQTIFELKKEIMLPGVYKHNPNERFLIYSLC